MAKTLCSHILEGSREIQDYLYVPLAPIADWLVHSFQALRFEERAALFPTTRRLHECAERWMIAQPPPGVNEDDWYDARYDWWSRHSLRTGGEGALLPDIGLLRDDEHLAISWDVPNYFADNSISLLVPRGEFEVDWDTGAAVLRRFVSEVGRWLRESDAAEAFDWANVPDPLASPDSPFPEALEFFTGRSTTELTNLFGVDGPLDLLKRLRLSQSTIDPAASPECQVLRDLSPFLPREVGDVLAELGEIVRHEDQDALKRWRVGRGVALDAARSARTIEDPGTWPLPKFVENSA